ncbi:bifunctional folylpolyglutamate synthase/dihydrofolate synthase [Azospirillum halopraeferens]|uniref:bifunctional folylpolyglutamate synthase/dihydrofolate synthase n=1 Tax=Azospirillum halopraeferens TaxID=34010 RepID=UPI000408B384|nr:cyanophycin synthetase [Azospirillum halopraeferens]
MTGAADPGDIIGRLMRLPKAGSGIGLHRMAWLLEPLLAAPGGWKVDALKVTGSNGKGSVARMAAEMLQRLGLSAGLYTSPHLRRFNERIVVDGASISDADLVAAAGWFEERRAAYGAAHPGDGFGAFEAFTAMAMHHFAGRRPAALVAEAGIGGRYDSVRAIPGRIAALTSLDFEHTDILGPTLELIAYDKADLCPDGGTLVVGDIDAELFRRLAAYAALRRITLVSWRDVGCVHAVRIAAGGMEADLTLGGVRLDGVAFALPGRHQTVNALVAAGMVRAWLAARGALPEPAVFAAAFRDAVAAVRWPGRLERVHDDPPVVIDVGHTPDAISTTLQALPALAAGRPVLLVTGVSANKDADGIVGALAGAADAILCTRAWHRGSDVERIRTVAGRARPDLSVEVAETIEEAMARAVDRARAGGMLVLVAGGLFLAIEAAEALAGRDPRALRFF